MWLINELKHKLYTALSNLLYELRLRIYHLSRLLNPSSHKHHYWGTLAVGILLVAQDTGKVFIQHRSKRVSEGDTWGICGGAVSTMQDDSGNPSTEDDYRYYNNPQNSDVKNKVLLSTALRELEEEAGFRGMVTSISKFFHFVAPDPKTLFEYHSFVGLVQEQFVPCPMQGAEWESCGYAWVEMRSLLEYAKVGTYKDVKFHSGFRRALLDPKVQQMLLSYVDGIAKSDEELGLES